jgi:hypothetical protein
MSAEKVEVPGVPFALKIEPEAVNQMVAQAIMNSVLGIKMKEGIEEAVKKLTLSSGYGYTQSNPIVDIANAYVRQEMSKIISEDFGDVIRDKVRAALTDQFTDEIIKEMVANLWKNR